jgi:2-polyprenyl-3-methyl-5-hydroxy-6-metoxy-1,4-benzoquinol methylase
VFFFFQRRLDREPLEFIIHWHFIKQYLPSCGSVLDNGAGPGKYAMAFAKLGYQVTLSDLTTKLVEIAKEKAQYPQAWKPNNSIDAINHFQEMGTFDHTDAGRCVCVLFYLITWKISC